ncbi:hypothetical protein SAMN02927913_2110 [Frateuria terrea]|nr:hypothetical protein SAMN02927913_2110 [Frateuria terrea]
MSAVEPQRAYAAPAPEEYCALRCAAGLSAMDEAAATAGLPASWCAASLRAGDEPGRMSVMARRCCRWLTSPCGRTGSGEGSAAPSWLH